MFRFTQYRVILTVCSATYLHGMLLGWAAPAMPKLMDVHQSPLSLPLTGAQVSLVATLSVLFVFASLLSGPISNAYGRRPCIILSTLVTIVAWLATATASSVEELYLAKTVGAQADGFIYGVCITYLSEVASSDIRGLALTAIPTSSNLGMLTMFTLGPYVSFSTLALVPAGVAAVALLMMVFLPESPVFYAVIGDKENTRMTLKYLNKSDLKLEETLLPNPKKDNLMSILKELFTVRKNLKAFALVSFLDFSQQSSGINGILFNATTMFKASGSPTSPHVSTIIIGCIQVFSGLLSNLFVDNLGRRPLLLASSFMTAVSTFVLGTYFYLALNEFPIVTFLRWLPLSCMIVYILFFYCGLGAIPQTLTGELVDPRIKSVSSSIAFAIENVAALLIVSTYISLSSTLGMHNTFWLYSLSCAITCVFVALFVPETKGMSFDEIQELL